MNQANVPTTLGAIGLAAVGSFAWMLYFRTKDKISPEPRRRVWQAFGLGMVAAGVAWLGYLGAALAGFPPSPPEDPAALASAIDLALADPAAARTRVLTARAHLAECFSPDEWVSRHLAVYQRVMERRPQ